MAATLVQNSGKRSTGGTTSEAWTWVSAPTVGNKVLVTGVSWTSGGSGTMSCTDNASPPNTYTQVATRASGTTTRSSVFEATIVNVPTITTVSMSSAADHSMTFGEWSGLASGASFDQSATASSFPTAGGATTLSVGPTATLSQAAELVISLFGGALNTSNALITAPTGFTLLGAEQDSHTFIAMGASYEVVASTAALTVAQPFTSIADPANDAAGVVATFKIAAGGTSIAPGVGSVALSGYAPTVARTANQALTPGVGSLAITGYAPTIAQGAGQNVSPGVGSVAITGYAPAVAQTANRSLSPGVGALALTGYAPGVAQTANQGVVPGVGSLAITGFAPVITQASSSPNLAPGAGVLTITGYAPDVSQGRGGGIDSWGSVYVRKKKQKPLPTVAGPVSPSVRETIEKAFGSSEPTPSTPSTAIDFADDDEDEEVLMLLL